MTQPPNTRGKMIEAAITLMRRSGLSGAGINEIVKESGAPKGSMYYFFPGGKRQIISEALAVYGERVVSLWDKTLSPVTNPTDKIHALFNALSERMDATKYRQSCAAGAVCLDLEDAALEPVRVVIAAAFSTWVDVIRKHFPMHDPVRQKSFAGLVLTTVEGAFIRARAERSAAPFSEAAHWLADIASREVAKPKSSAKVRRP